jgi:hypothetical protein
LSTSDSSSSIQPCYEPLFALPTGGSHCMGELAQTLVLRSAVQNGGDEEGKRHNGNALPRMRRLQRSGSISFTQRQARSPPNGLLQAPYLQRRAVCLGPTRQEGS